MGRAYLSYAMTHPLQYQLMFYTPLPEPEQHSEMMESARHAFSLLKDCLSRMKRESGMAVNPETELDALFIWSTLHGLATLLQTRAIDTLPLTNELLQTVTRHTMFRIGMALNFEVNKPVYPSYPEDK